MVFFCLHDINYLCALTFKTTLSAFYCLFYAVSFTSFVNRGIKNCDPSFININTFIIYLLNAIGIAFQQKVVKNLEKV